MQLLMPVPRAPVRKTFLTELALILCLPVHCLLVSMQIIFADFSSANLANCGHIQGRLIWVPMVSLEVLVVSSYEVVCISAIFALEGMSILEAVVVIDFFMDFQSRFVLELLLAFRTGLCRVDAGFPNTFLTQMNAEVFKIAK